MANGHRTERKIFDWLKFIFCIEKIEFYFTQRTEITFLPTHYLRWMKLTFSVECGDYLHRCLIRIEKLQKNFTTIFCVTNICRENIAFIVSIPINLILYVRLALFPELTISTWILLQQFHWRRKSSHCFYIDYYIFYV